MLRGADARQEDLFDRVTALVGSRRSVADDWQVQRATLRGLKVTSSLVWVSGGKAHALVRAARYSARRQSVNLKQP